MTGDGTLKAQPESPLLPDCLNAGHTHPGRRWAKHFAQARSVPAWIVIEAAAWTELQLAGQITCPASYAPQVEEFVEAYAWLKAEMAEAGIPAPDPGLTPWWVWVQREPGHPQPFLDDLQGMGNPVVLELRLPPGELILSCFDAWHAVLNRWTLYDSPEAEAAIEVKIRAGGPEAESALVASWMQVFDLAQLYGDPLGPDKRCVQGCIWQIRLEYVTRVVSTAELDSLPLS